MKRKIKAGTTQFSLTVIVYDNTSTNGGGLSGLTHLTSGLILEYRRAGSSSWTQLGVGTGLVSKTLGSYTSGGIVANGARAGRYEIDIPDAALVAGARFVEICLRGAANMHPVDIEIELDAVDYQNATNFGLSKFGDIETDTQDIQSRLPSALIGGRMDVSVGGFQAGLVPANFSVLSIDPSGQINSVGIVDELGPNALLANDLANEIGVATFSQLTTYAWPNNSLGKHLLISNDSNRSVKVVGAGAGHVAADVHAIQPGVIVAGSFAANAIDANALAADAATEIATAVGNLQAISRLDSMIESNGGGQFRFDTIALSLAPSGGGGGGTGTGANTVTLTVLLAGSPVEGAKVRLTKAAESYLGTTNASGQVVFNVDNGSWIVAITSPNTTFAGAVLAVTGNQSASYTVTAISITPSAPGNVTGYWLVLGANGLPESGAVISMQAVSVECGNPGLALDTAVRTATSDGAGVAQFANLTPGVRYQAWRGTGAKLYISIPLDASGSLELSSLLGSP